MWRYHKLNRCFGKVTLGLLLIFVLSIFWNLKSAFAAPVITMSIPTDVNLNLIPGYYNSADLQIDITTNSSNGYNLFMYTGSSTTNMISTVNPSFVIPTITLPSGTTSVTSSQVQNGYAYSPDGTNFKPAPAVSGNGDVIAEMPNVTPNATNTHTVTFGAKVGTDVRAGDYTQVFVFKVVANNPDFCGSYSICYYGNDDDGRGTMEDQSASSNSSVTLMASNFSRPGYGFAGWNTDPDGTGTDYGPSQTITTGDLSGLGLRLYAKWIASSGNLQGWNSCPSMNIGDVIALTDTRDNNTYAIAKLADGRCWMIENLRLDLSNPSVTIDANNTNNPTASFITAANNHPASTNDFCAQNNTGCLDNIKFNTNNINRLYAADYATNDNQSSWYSYGVYYNWYAGTAGHGTYAFNHPSASTSGDICPAGWRLPNGYSEDYDFGKLDIALGGTGVEQTTAASSERWRIYPNNYIYSGEQRTGTAYNRDVSGSYTTSSVATDTSVNNLWLRKTAVAPSHNKTYKYRGQPIRCVVKEQYSASNYLHYEANGGTGTMNDRSDVHFTSDHADTNRFTRAHYQFTSWNTKADGTGVVVLEAGPLEAAANSLGLEDGDTLTLYAIWRPVYNILYDANGADAGSMSNVRHNDAQGKIQLIPPNLMRSGYGFAGWSPDPDAATKLANNQTVKVYGPNQTITVDNTLTSVADSNFNITLYAVWIPAPSGSGRTMQSFTSSSCASMATNDIVALVDSRDNNTYAVAKLADGHCWMLENLRLVPSSTTFSSSNTNGPTADFISAAPSSSTSNVLCNANNSACMDQIQFNANNLNTSLTPAYNTNNTTSYWLSYGVMYNWYTATAGNGLYSRSSGSATGDICPTGWRLPTGGSSGDYSALTKKGTVTNFPFNFINSGDFNNKVPGGRGTFGRWWSSTATNNNAAYRLGISSTGATPTGSWNKWDGFAVRCIVK